MIVAAARVSTTGIAAMQYAIDQTVEFNENPGGVMAKRREDTSGIINYLIKNRHGSPFEHSAMTFFVHAPIFVWRIVEEDCASGPLLPLPARDGMETRR